MRFFCVFYNISFLSSQNLQTVKELSTASESSNIYFEVTNTGKVRADEIAQVYLSPTQSNQQYKKQQNARILQNIRAFCLSFQ